MFRDWLHSRGGKAKFNAPSAANTILAAAGSADILKASVRVQLHSPIDLQSKGHLAHHRLTTEAANNNVTSPAAAKFVVFRQFAAYLCTPSPEVHGALCKERWCEQNSFLPTTSTCRTCR